jgi:hypothetical protein
LKSALVQTPSLIQDLRWLGRKCERLLLREARKRLEQDPLARTRNMKDLRPNRLAQRELRLFGKYRLLFNVDPLDGAVTLVGVGLKHGSMLCLRGRELPWGAMEREPAHAPWARTG